MSDRTDKELERTVEIFEFLQGRIPEGTFVEKKNRPNLTAEQAWTVIWFLGNAFFQVPDSVERCDVCGELYHTHCGGDCLDYGKAPYHFCDGCLSSPEYAAKLRRKPKEQQPEPAKAPQPA